MNSVENRKQNDPKRRPKPFSHKLNMRTELRWVVASASKMSKSHFNASMRAILEVSNSSVEERWANTNGENFA